MFFHAISVAQEELMPSYEQTTIECAVDVTTTDGYKLRLFCIAFTKRRQNQLKKTTYAQTAQIKQIRKKMTDIMTKEAS